VKTIAILSEKGGAGKTTVAVHLAVAAELARLDVAIIDLDNAIGSASEWSDRRGSTPDAVAIPPHRLEQFLPELRDNDTDLVVIDTGRDSNNAAYLAASSADLVLVPCRGAGGFDIVAVGKTLDICRLARKRPCLLLNGLRPGAKRVEAEARAELAADDCQIAPVVFHERAVYRDASISTRTAQEVEPRSDAAGEIETLFLWICKQLDLPTTRRRDRKKTA